MKIVITGNLGYVGAWVTRQLRVSYPDAWLVGVDMGYFAHCLTDAPCAPEVLLDAQYIADVRRFPTEVLRGTDAVVHLAAVSNDPMGHAYEDVTRQVNHVAAAAVARQAKAAGVSAFVFASSCSVYGAADDRPRTERSSLNPLTTYAKSKILAEQALCELAGPTFRITCLRFATACGMSDRLRLDLVLNDFVASAMSTGGITVLSDGTPWRPLINVADMARAIDWAVGRDADAGGDFLIVNAGSDGWNYQVSELADAVARTVPGTEVSINRQAPADKRSYRVDFSLFASLAPGHQPCAGLTDTVVGLRRGLECMGFSNPDFRSSSLIRLQALAALGARGLLGPSLEWTNVPAKSGLVSDPRPPRSELTARL